MVLSLTTCVCQAQVFHLEQVADTAAMLVLTTDAMRSEWKIDYPVYRFQQCDIDGDGTREAVVGVVKPTRFDRSIARRVFIFKNFRGWIRPMWMGSNVPPIIPTFFIAPPINRISDKILPIMGSFLSEKSRESPL